MNQLSLPFKASICDKFLAFHEANPEVYELFKQFAFQLIEVGHKHYSADGIGHRIRWHTSIRTTDRDFKINNNYIAWYSRLFEEDHPEHKGFFRKRKVRG